MQNFFIQLLTSEWGADRIRTTSRGVHIANLERPGRAPVAQLDRALAF